MLRVGTREAGVLDAVEAIPSMGYGRCDPVRSTNQPGGRREQFTCPGVLDVAIHRQHDHSDLQVLLGSSIIISSEVVMSQQQDPASLIHLESNSRQHKSLLNEAASMEEA